jgi:TRAP transporter 4TM/12TM fusion protein
VSAQKLRVVHLGLVLPLSFLIYPAHRRLRRLNALDVALAILGVASMGYVLMDFDAFLERSSDPRPADVAFGLLAMLLVLEAGRRTAGALLPALAAVALAYALGGAALPAPWSHRGYDLGRVVGLEYMGLEGIFGTPLAVCATLIVLFTLYGAVLDQTGAGRFFVDFSLALAPGRRGGAGRTVTLASFLLGGPSGSGVATAVTLGSIAYPVLARAGYGRERAAAVLSAGGIGAVLSPPVMGAASFLIAELNRVSYLEVIRWSVVPTLLYYLGVLLMVERDAVEARAAAGDAPASSAPALARRYGFHFTSLVAIVVFLALGWSAPRAVLACMALAAAVSFLRPESALTPSRLVKALVQAARGVVAIAATCATAGILVGALNLTGLGLKFSGILLELGGGSLLPTLVMAALLLLVLGLALPITASYIVAAVMTAPALVRLGVPAPAAHMFIFYYALLSEVTPPTALSCMATSALTGANPYRTMWITWGYTLPAFLVPFMIAAPGGTALLLLGPRPQVLLASVTALAGVWLLVMGIRGARSGTFGVVARALLAAAGLLLLHPAGAADLAGLGLLVAAFLPRLLRRRGSATVGRSSPRCGGC